MKNRHCPMFAISLAILTSIISANAAAAGSKRSEAPLPKEDQQIARLVRLVNSNPSDYEKLRTLNISIDRYGRPRQVKLLAAVKTDKQAAALKALTFPTGDGTFTEKRIKLQFLDRPSSTGTKLSQRVRTVTTCGGVASGG